jgi:tetraacyldisaccharide 4'-kinase
LIRVRDWEKYLLEVIRGKHTGLFPILALGILTLLEQVYRLLLTVNSLTKKKRGLPLPVISVGNLIAGGAGKTPTIVWLARQLQAVGLQPAVLTRGYGGTMVKDGQVLTPDVLRTANPANTGDEPFLLAKLLSGTPTAVGRDRYRMGLQVLAARPNLDLFLLDDGFQYFGLNRNLDIVLLDATAPFDNGHLLPRGLLREPPSALKRAQVVLLTRTAQVSEAALVELSDLIKKYNPQALIGEVEAENSTVEALNGWGNDTNTTLSARQYLKGRRIGLVTAIGNPEQLRYSIQTLGAEIAYFEVYPDHHVWDGVEVAEIIANLKMNQLTDLLVTGKDGVKLLDFTAELQLNGVDCYILNLDFKVANPEIAALIRRVALRKG